MKLFSEWKKIYIGEARRNPEKNPKVSAYEQLKPYFNNENAYISFTSVDKLGINPRSKFNTPLGIYSYPLKEIKEFYSGTENDWEKNQKVYVPFAGDRDYIWLFFSKRPDRVLELSEYDSTDWDRDVKILRKIAKKYNVLIYFNEMVSEAKYSARVRNPAGYFWYITMVLSETIESYTKKSIMRWNSIFRKLGYDGITDKKGQGIIHEMEPVQAVWFSKEAINVKNKILNKDYSNKYIPLEYRSGLFTWRRKQGELGRMIVDIVVETAEVPDNIFAFILDKIRDYKIMLDKKEISLNEFKEKTIQIIQKYTNKHKNEIKIDINILENYIRKYIRDYKIEFLNFLFNNINNNLFFNEIIKLYYNGGMKGFLYFIGENVKNYFGLDSEEFKYYEKRMNEIK